MTSNSLGTDRPKALALMDASGRSAQGYAIVPLMLSIYLLHEKSRIKIHLINSIRAEYNKSHSFNSNFKGVPTIFRI